ncbi:hypothetical protein VNO80_17532 [Phaseolus coccineus]|uniref:Rho-GAP domain-containing protein n=1 Tax=Phaseolus coccineus TaxID=3886 RepID=A0AAN9QYK8_PHACN
MYGCRKKKSTTISSPSKKQYELEKSRKEKEAIISIENNYLTELADRNKESSGVSTMVLSLGIRFRSMKARTMRTRQTSTPEDDGEAIDASSPIPLDDVTPVDFGAIEVIQLLVEHHNAIFTDANETVWKLIVLLMFLYLLVDLDLLKLLSLMCSVIVVFLRGSMIRDLCLLVYV